MDPNENLRRQRELAKKMHELPFDDCGGEAEELANLVEALDDWITKGGFLPDDWRKNRVNPAAVVPR